MNIFDRFRKKSDHKETADPHDPDLMPAPVDLAGYMRRGWAYHSRGKETQAEADFLKALEIAPDSVDAHYVLGLVFKAQGKKEDAIRSFKRTIELLEAGAVSDTTRTDMLRRLALGHINELTIGDWNLEEQIWHYKR